MSWKVPVAGVLRIECDFHGSEVNSTGSCPFLKGKKSGKSLLHPFKNLKNSIAYQSMSHPHLYIVFTAISMHERN